jgi:hypothetical protein
MRAPSKLVKNREGSGLRMVTQSEARSLCFFEPIGSKSIRDELIRAVSREFLIFNNH